MNSEKTPLKKGIRGAFLLIGVGAAGLLALNLREVFFPKTLEKDLRQAQILLGNSFQKNKKLDSEVQRLSEKNLYFMKTIEEKNKREMALEEQLKKQAAALKELSRKQQESDEEKRRNEIKKKFTEAKKSYRPDYSPVRRENAAPLFDSAASGNRSWQLVPPPAEGEEKTNAAPESAENEIKGKPIIETESAKREAMDAEILKKEEEKPEALVPDPPARKEREAERSMFRKTVPARPSDNQGDFLSAAQMQQAGYYYNLGVAYTQGDRYDEAAEMYEKAVAINPRDASAHYNLGIIYDDYLGKTPKGITHYRAFLELSRDEEKKRIVKEWIEIAENKRRNSGDNYYQSAKKSFDSILFTKAG